MRTVFALRTMADQARDAQQKAGDAMRLNESDAEVFEALRYFEGVEDALRWAAGDTRNTISNVMLASIEDALQRARAIADGDKIVDGAGIVFAQQIADAVVAARTARRAAANAPDPAAFGREHLAGSDQRNAWLLEPLPAGWTGRDVVVAIQAGCDAEAGQ